MGGLRAFAAELAGTFALTLAASGAVCMDAVTGGRLGPMGISLAYAAAAASTYYAFPGSVWRFNPALTLADLLVRRASWLGGIFALAAQLLGAVCAGLFLRAVLAGGHPELLGSPAFLGSCEPMGIGYRAATLIEAVLTFFFACTVFASTPRRRRALGPMAVGACALFAGLAAQPLTGAAMNPARAFGPALVSAHWSQHYVYWVGPLAGAVLAALLAPYIVYEEKLP